MLNKDIDKIQYALNELKGVFKDDYHYINSITTESDFVKVNATLMFDYKDHQKAQSDCKNPQ